MIHYNPATHKVVLRGKIKNDTHKRWIYIKILGKAKSTNCGAADREARGHGYYLGWVNPNHGHLVINFEVKTAANHREAAKEFPEMMELQANGHMLVAFPDADDIQGAMQSLCELDPEAKRVTPSEHAAKKPSSDREEEPRPATPPFEGKEQITKCLRKWEAAYTKYAEMLQKVANGTALSEEQIAFQDYIEQGKVRLTEFKLIVAATPDKALENIWEDIYQATHDYTNGQQTRLYSRAFPKAPRDFRYPGPQQVNNKITYWEKSERRFQGTIKKLSGSQTTNFISLLEEFRKALKEFKETIQSRCTTGWEPIWNTLAPRIEELQKLLVEHLPTGA